MRGKTTYTWIRNILVHVAAAGTAILLLYSFVSAEDDSFERGLSSYMKRDYSSAVAYFKEHVARMPDAEAYYFLGYASYELGQTKDAAGYFREAYLIDPNFTPMVRNYGKPRR
jgi:TolA-binding protein